MALILCIDTSTTYASVALAKEMELLRLTSNENQKDHASFLQPAILNIAEESGYRLTDLDAIAVTSGPGSYTGLRVGFASAKGLCYALNKPLITISTTKVMARAAVTILEQTLPARQNILLCPMIDARRMEVFTALYTAGMDEKISNQALILSEDSFADFLSDHDMFFFGSGADKWKTICKNPHAYFPDVKWDASHMITDVFKQFHDNSFASLAYSSPEYIKDFHSVFNK